MLSKSVVVVDELPVFEVDTETIIDSPNGKQRTIRQSVTPQARMKIPGSGSEGRCAIGWNPIKRREVDEMLPGSWSSGLGPACKQAGILIGLDRQQKLERPRRQRMQSC